MKANIFFISFKWTKVASKLKFGFSKSFFSFSYINSLAHFLLLKFFYVTSMFKLLHYLKRISIFNNAVYAQMKKNVYILLRAMFDFMVKKILVSNVQVKIPSEP